jgi:hypothetical protein
VVTGFDAHAHAHAQEMAAAEGGTGSHSRSGTGRGPASGDAYVPHTAQWAAAGTAMDMRGHVTQPSRPPPSTPSRQHAGLHSHSHWASAHSAAEQRAAALAWEAEPPTMPGTDSESGVGSERWRAGAAGHPQPHAHYVYEHDLDIDGRPAAIHAPVPRTPISGGGVGAGDRPSGSRGADCAGGGGCTYFIHLPVVLCDEPVVEAGGGDAAGTAGGDAAGTGAVAHQL